MAQKKKQLVAAGKLDKFGRPNSDTPQASLECSTPRSDSRVLHKVRLQAGTVLLQEYLRSLGESAGSQGAGDGESPRVTGTSDGKEAAKVSSVLTRLLHGLACIPRPPVHLCSPLNHAAFGGEEEEAQCRR